MKKPSSRRLVLCVLVLVVVAVGAVILRSNDETKSKVTTSSSSAMTLTLATPRVDDEYYRPFYEDIVSFQIRYAQSIIDHGRDTVQILADAQTIERYGDELPSGVFIEAPMRDIWMRDFTLVDPHNPVRFTYTDASMSLDEAISTQAQFSDYADAAGVEYAQTDLIIDGGNIVDNHAGRVVTTTRFLEDNNFTYEQGVTRLKEVLRATQVAIIEPDDEVLAHADGMVAWLDENTLAVNDYSATDPEFHQLVTRELELSFPGVSLVPVPVQFDDDGADTTLGIGSACGINLNLVMTPSTLYVPVFDMPHETETLRLIRENTTKQVVEIPANGVCRLGGSARCTVWQH